MKSSHNFLAGTALATVMCIAAPAHAGLLGGGANGALGGGASGALGGGLPGGFNDIGRMGAVDGSGTGTVGGSMEGNRPSLAYRDVSAGPLRRAGKETGHEVGKDVQGHASSAASNVTSATGETATTQSAPSASQATQPTATAPKAPKTTDAAPAAAEPAPAPSLASGALGGSTDQSTNAAGRNVDANAKGSAAAEHASRNSFTAAAGDGSASVSDNP